MAATKSKTPAALADALQQSGAVVRQAIRYCSEVEPFVRAWSHLAPAAAGNHSRPVLYKDGLLTVWCDSSVWATTLRHASPTIIRRLSQAKLPKVRSLRIRVKPPDALLGSSRQLTERKPPTQESLHLIGSIARSIHDPELRASLERLEQTLGRCDAPKPPGGSSGDV